MPHNLAVDHSRARSREEPLPNLSKRTSDMTVGDERVREDHRQWDGMVVHIDDPWWNTHMPLNGFGCRCTVVSLSEADLEPRELEASTPQDNLQEQVIPKTGEIVRLPEGVDYGFDANSGKNWNAPEMALGERLAVLSNMAGSGGLAMASRTAAERYIKRQNAPIAAAYKPWIEGVLNDQRMIRGRAVTVGYIDMAVFAYFAQNGLPPIRNAAIVLSDRQVQHMLRDKKKARDAALSSNDVQRIPSTIARPEAILYDKEDKDEDKKGKLVVRIDQRKGGGRIANQIRTGGIVPAHNLRESRYSLIKGNVD